MRKIVIVTVYNSENCGSFFQAYAMQTVLKKCGFDVAFYQRDTAGTSHAVFPHIRSSIKKIMQMNFKEIKFVCKPWFTFEKATKLFEICDEKSDFYQNTEIFLLGSDTIWNFDSKYFRKQSRVYLGNIFENKYVISFAASAANTASKIFHDVVQQNGGLKHISRFLVRDVHTKELVESETSCSAQIVTDPTLLLHKEDYLKLVSDETIRYPFILLYYFGEIDEELQKEIQQYARKRNLKIISLLKYRKWCDDSVIADPFKMIFYYNKAESVITNTFHGCAFSMIFEKPFAVYDEGKNKVKDLLFKYGEDKRLFSEPGKIPDLLEQSCEVLNNGKFDLIREQSMDLLYEALKIDNE